MHLTGLPEESCLTVRNIAPSANCIYDWDSGSEQHRLAQKLALDHRFPGTHRYVYPQIPTDL
jgi:hypothetical protein